MSTQVPQPASPGRSNPRPNGLQVQLRSRGPAMVPFQLTSCAAEGDQTRRQAELFYLQKQIQTQTPMVIALEGGEKIKGVIEWYDRDSLKVRGRQKMLVYKSAIKYMYKANEAGQ